MAETPPLNPAAPSTTRREITMGYHQAVIERVQAEGKPVRWMMTPFVQLAEARTKIEALFYDDEQIAVDEATKLLVAAQGIEDAIRRAWYTAYGPARGRLSAPEVPGPAWVDPQPPTISATAANAPVMPDATTTLAVTVTEHGPITLDPLDFTWSKMDGPGDASFTPITATTFEAAFTQAGEYLLEVVGEATGVRVSTQVTVVVEPEPNEAPVVQMPSGLTTQEGVALTLDPTVTDDGKPAGSSLTFSWSSNAADATFSTPDAIPTDVTFPTAGTHEVRLSVSDGAATSVGVAQVTVDPAA